MGWKSFVVTFVLVLASAGAIGYLSVNANNTNSNYSSEQKAPVNSLMRRKSLKKKKKSKGGPVVASPAADAVNTSSPEGQQQPLPISSIDNTDIEDSQELVLEALEELVETGADLKVVSNHSDDVSPLVPSNNDAQSLMHLDDEISHLLLGSSSGRSLLESLMLSSEAGVSEDDLVAALYGGMMMEEEEQEEDTFQVLETIQEVPDKEEEDFEEEKKEALVATINEKPKHDALHTVPVLEVSGCINVDKPSAAEAILAVAAEPRTESIDSGCIVTTNEAIVSSDEVAVVVLPVADEGHIDSIDSDCIVAAGEKNVRNDDNVAELSEESCQEPEFKHSSSEEETQPSSEEVIPVSQPTPAKQPEETLKEDKVEKNIEDQEVINVNSSIASIIEPDTCSLEESPVTTSSSHTTPSTTPYSVEEKQQEPLDEEFFDDEASAAPVMTAEQEFSLQEQQSFAQLQQEVYAHQLQQQHEMIHRIDSPDAHFQYHHHLHNFSQSELRNNHNSTNAIYTAPFMAPSQPPSSNTTPRLSPTNSHDDFHRSPPPTINSLNITAQEFVPVSDGNNHMMPTFVSSDAAIAAAAATEVLMQPDMIMPPMYSDAYYIDQPIPDALYYGAPDSSGYVGYYPMDQEMDPQMYYQQQFDHQQLQQMHMMPAGYNLNASEFVPTTSCKFDY